MGDCHARWCACQVVRSGCPTTATGQPRPTRQATGHRTAPWQRIIHGIHPGERRPGGDPGGRRRRSDRGGQAAGVPGRLQPETRLGRRCHGLSTRAKRYGLVSGYAAPPEPPRPNRCPSGTCRSIIQVSWSSWTAFASAALPAPGHRLAVHRHRRRLGLCLGDPHDRGPVTAPDGVKDRLCLGALGRKVPV